MNKIYDVKILIIGLFFINLGACTGVKGLSSDALIEAQRQGVVVIDIRTPEEWYKYGTIKGAKRIMFYDVDRKPKISEFMAEFEKVVTYKNQPFILVCRTGSRTARAIQYLVEKQGYTRASHLAKGMKKWLAEGRAVEK